MNQASKNSYTVSVVIPTYNAAPYIGRAIDSVLAQSRSANEIIVVDDGSADNTAEIVRGYGSKVRYVHQANAGACAARNAGIGIAQSQWIAFLDADDEWLPEKLEIQVRHLQRNDDLVWSYGNFLHSDSTGVAPRLGHRTGRAERLLAGREFFDNGLIAFQAGFYVCNITLIVRRDILEEVGMFHVGQLRLQEADLSFRMAFRRPCVGYINQPLAIYHLDIAGRITTTHRKTDVLYDVVDRNLELAEQYNCQENFRPLAAIMVRGWIIDFLSQRQLTQARQVLEHYENLLPTHMLCEARRRIRMPWATPILLGIISRLRKLFTPRWWQAKLRHEEYDPWSP